MSFSGLTGFHRVLAMAAIAVSLSGCAHALSAVGQGDNGVPLPASCCENPEPYPKALVDLADAHAPVFGRAVAHAVVRPGWLTFHPDAIRHVAHILRPLDLVVTRSEGRLSNKLIPGAFAHFAVYVGPVDQLRDMGLWTHPAIAPHHAALRSGDVFIHATSAGVHATSASDIFNADDVVVLRPQGIEASRRRRVMTHLFSHIGTPFDFRADIDDTQCFTCIELVHHVLPELDLPVRRAYDRSVILPDEVVVRALNGDRHLRFETYVAAGPFGARIAGRNALAAEIRRAWPVPEPRQAMRQ